MSAEPPSSGRPTGPPSGPLSGPSQPPAGPPSQPPSGPPAQPSGAAPEPGPHRPWWRSAPRVAAIAAVVVAVVVVAVVLTRPDDSSSTASGKDGEIFLQAAGKSGPDPFTESTATDSSAPPVTPSPETASAPANAVRGVQGGAAGLYGGTRNVAACNVEQQIGFLQQDPAKNRAFAAVQGVEPGRVPGYLRSLTPVQLRLDTRVTNHGYRDGSATRYQAVLQSGTAVLVDDRGVPRVRCACGNPLTDPVAQQGTPERTGDSWPSYRTDNVVVVTPAPTVINVFVLYDPDHREWVARHQGDTGDRDKKTDRPDGHSTPSPSLSTPTAPPSDSGSPCPDTSDADAATCPPASESTSPESPPTSEPPTSEPGADGTDGTSQSADTTTPQAPLGSNTTTTTTSGTASAYTASESVATTPAL
ncbi:DUF6777 domain-containing protein [Streptomyces sp. NPDC088387]|uniref:DUF6777 domain-containing protein n=1 Tax=Streptomyces sp. NPDC088387 TaxID=3365859 RepID=UPI0037F49333